MCVLGACIIGYSSFETISSGLKNSESQSEASYCKGPISFGYLGLLPNNIWMPNIAKKAENI